MSVGWQVSQLNVPASEITHAEAKDLHGETGDTERKGVGRKELERERGEEEEQREERDSRQGDRDGPQRPWRPPRNVHPRGLG